MKRDLEALQKETFDLLVIGGGINGAAIAHLAALRGKKVALIEKNDFASGTSGKSSKLMHGGLRYLEKLHFSLVREALSERYFHVQKAPHLVSPIPFILPVYRGDRRPLWLIHAGVLLYDYLSGRQRIGNVQRLSAKEILEREPRLKKEGLKGGMLYYDAQMDDVRICLENVLSAAGKGAVVANYVEVVSLLKENGKVAGVRALDRLGGTADSFEIRAHKTVGAVGPWSNALALMDNPESKEVVRPTKGVHLVTKKKLSEHALLVTIKKDNRIFFILPWKSGTMIGTTDTDYQGDPDRVEPSVEDVRYLLGETKRVFPNEDLSEADFSVRFAGLRPLISSGGSASGVSREHEILETPSGLFMVVGGKYTTYRCVAEDCLERLGWGSGPAIECLYGSCDSGISDLGDARSWNCEPETFSYFCQHYGSRARDLLEMIRTEPELARKIDKRYPYVLAELIYAVRVTMAMNEADILERRLSLATDPAWADESFRRSLNQAVNTAKPFPSN